MTDRDADGNVIDPYAALFNSANRRDAGLAEIIATLRGPRPHDPLPPSAITGEQWRGSCRGAGDGSERCGACCLCRRDAAIDARAFAAPWADAPRQERTERSYVWTSVVAALAAFSQWRLDGYSSPSATGPILDRLRDGMTGDTHAGGTDYHRARTDLAASLAAIEVALSGAYRTAQSRHGLNERDCLRVLFARTVGDEVTEHRRGGHAIRTRVRPDVERVAGSLGVSAREVEEIAKHGRDYVYVELAARGLLPEPRMRARLRVEALTRRERLLRRSCR